MSSGTSTESRPAKPDGGFEAWHFYVLVSMVAATVAVMLSPNTHPAALLLLSGAVIAAGLVGLAAHRAMAGFVAPDDQPPPAGTREREALEREKALALRSIKELEFDRAMGKVSEKDFESIGAGLRARAMSLIEELDRLAAPPPAPPAEAGARDVPDAPAATCPSCGTSPDADARFCKQCGTRL